MPSNTSFEHWGNDLVDKQKEVDISLPPASPSVTEPLSVTRARVLASMCSGISNEMFDQYIQVLVTLKAMHHHPEEDDGRPLEISVEVWETLPPGVKRLFTKKLRAG